MHTTTTTATANEIRRYAIKASSRHDPLQLDAHRDRLYRMFAGHTCALDLLKQLRAHAEAAHSARRYLANHPYEASARHDFDVAARRLKRTVDQLVRIADQHR